MLTERKTEDLMNEMTDPLNPINMDGKLFIHPSYVWYDEYMEYSIKCGLLSKLEESIDSMLDEFRTDMDDCFHDIDYQSENFPFQSKEKVLKYFDEEYMDVLDSELVYQIKRSIRKLWNTIPNPLYKLNKKEQEFHENLTN
jgi:hypothetical protein